MAEVARCELVAKNKRYPSDLTDAQWELIEPLVPAPRSGGRPAVHSRRRVVDAILYVDRTGCAWRQLPHDFPPWATVFWYFKRWREDGVVDRIHDALRDRVRDASRAGPAWPRPACVDAQSVKGADTVGAAVRGFDAGKKVNGRKRHVVVDTMGLLLAVVITSASVQDRDGARTVLDRLKMAMPVAVAAVGRRRLRRQTGRLGRPGCPHHRRDRAQTHGTSRRSRRFPGGGWSSAHSPGSCKCRRLDHDYERLPKTRGHDQMGDDRADGPTARAATRPQAVAAHLNRRLRLSRSGVSV